VTRNGPAHATKSWIYLAGLAVILTALMSANTGVLLTTPQDEGAYVFGAQSVHEKGIRQQIVDAPPSDPLTPTNPATLLRVRFIALWLLALPLNFFPPSLQVFGMTGTVLTVLAFACSLALLRQGATAFLAVSVSVAAFANPALLLAAGRALPDASMAACLMVAFAALSPTPDRPPAWWRLALAGCLMGSAILIKEGAAILLPTVLVVTWLFAVDRRFVRVLFVGGIAGVVVISGYALIALMSPDHLWVPDVVRAAHHFKYFVEQPAAEKSGWPAIHALVRPGYPWLYHARNIVFAGGVQIGSLHYVPIVFSLALATLASFGGGTGRRLSTVLTCLLPTILAWATLEFGPTDIFFNGGGLAYALIFKEADSFKFAIFLAPPLLVSLHQAALRSRAAPDAVLVCAFAVTLMSVGAAILAKGMLLAPVDAIVSQRNMLNRWLDDDQNNLVVSDSYSSQLLDLSLSRKYRDRFLDFSNFHRRYAASGVGQPRQVLYFRSSSVLPIDLAPGFQDVQRAEFLRLLPPHPVAWGPGFAIYVVTMPQGKVAGIDSDSGSSRK
jgi:hypothetical protein